MRRHVDLLNEGRPLFDLCANLLEDMPEWLADQRAVRGLGLVRCGEEIGISYNTIWRIEGRKCGFGAYSAIEVMRWLAKQ